MEKSFAEANKKVPKLEAKVERLKIEALEAKNVSIAEFKEFEAYKFDLTETTALLLTKEKVKVERLL